jgi:5'-nucleotidase
VVSGINAGANVGGAIVHSGTVGGAITAATFAIPALAISLAPPVDGAEWAWSTAAAVGRAMVAWMLGDGRPRTVNVNVPSVATSELRGPCWASLADFGTFVLAAADTSPDEPRTELRVEQPGTPAPGSDRALLVDGFVTASALAVLEAHGTAAGLPPLPDLP